MTSADSPQFIPGLRLAELFFRQAVRPIITRHWPRLRYSAALIGNGSEVLGLDTPMSRDHEWGPRVQLFLRAADHRRLAGRIHDTMAAELPTDFMGYSTHFGPTSEDGTCRVSPHEGKPINHRVQVHTLGGFGIDTSRPMAVRDWLTVTEQSLLELTTGGVFHDGLGRLHALRRRLAYYPRDVWLYMLACQWRRIGQDEHLHGRAGLVGDEIGSRIIAARLVRDVMRLCFLMERRYAPYAKWLGTAFGRLPCAYRFMPTLRKAMATASWRTRQRHLARAFATAGRMHNALGITKRVSPRPKPFFDRPFDVIFADRFADAIRAVIRNKDVRVIRLQVGSIDQFSDNTDMLESARVHRKLRAIYP